MNKKYFSPLDIAFIPLYNMTKLNKYDDGVLKITAPEYFNFSRLFAKKGGTALEDALSQRLFLCQKKEAL